MQQERDAPPHHWETDRGGLAAGAQKMPGMLLQKKLEGRPIWTLDLGAEGIIASKPDASLNANPLKGKRRPNNGG